MYDSIKTIKDEIFAVALFKAEPNHDTYTAAMRTKGMQLHCWTGINIDSALIRADMVLKYLYKELERRTAIEVRMETDRKVWETLHPKRELTDAEKDRLAAVKHMILIIQNCDAFNVNVCAELKDLYKEEAELEGRYYPL